MVSERRRLDIRFNPFELFARHWIRVCLNPVSIMRANVIPFSIPITFDIIVRVNQVSLVNVVKQISTIVRASLVRRTTRSASTESIRFIANAKKITNEVRRSGRKLRRSNEKTFVGRLGRRLRRAESVRFVAVPSERDLLQSERRPISLHVSAECDGHSMRRRYRRMLSFSFHLPKRWNVRNPSPCSSRANRRFSCVNEIGSYRCYCPAGWTGPTCAKAIDHCLSQPCQRNGTCLNKVNFGSFHHCLQFSLGQRIRMSMFNGVYRSRVSIRYRRMFN